MLRKQPRITAPYAILTLGICAGAAERPIAAWICGVVGLALAVLVSHFIYRIERDYQGVRAIFRDATARARKD